MVWAQNFVNVKICYNVLLQEIPDDVYYLQRVPVIVIPGFGGAEVAIQKGVKVQSHGNETTPTPSCCGGSPWYAQVPSRESPLRFLRNHCLSPLGDTYPKLLL